MFKLQPDRTKMEKHHKYKENGLEIKIQRKKKPFKNPECNNSSSLCTLTCYPQKNLKLWDNPWLASE